MTLNVLTEGNIGKFLESAVRKQATIDRTAFGRVRGGDHADQV